MRKYFMLSVLISSAEEIFSFSVNANQNMEPIEKTLNKYPFYFEYVFSCDVKTLVFCASDS